MCLISSSAASWVGVPQQVAGKARSYCASKEVGEASGVMPYGRASAVRARSPALLVGKRRKDECRELTTAVGRRAYFPASEVLYSPTPDNIRREKVAFVETKTTPRVSAAGPPTIKT